MTDGVVLPHYTAIIRTGYTVHYTPISQAIHCLATIGYYTVLDSEARGPSVWRELQTPYISAAYKSMALGAIPIT